MRKKIHDLSAEERDTLRSAAKSGAVFTIRGCRYKYVATDYRVQPCGNCAFFRIGDPCSYSLCVDGYFIVKARRYGFEMKLWETGRYILIHRDWTEVVGELKVKKGTNYPIAIDETTYTADGRFRAGCNSPKDLMLIHR